MNNNIFQRANIPLPDEILSAREAGDWALAQDILSGWLERDLPACLRERLELEQYYLSQMRGQYPLTGPALVAEMQQRIPDFSPDDLHQLLVTGWLDTRMVDGQRHYHEDSVASLLKANPDVAARAGQPLLPPSEVLDPIIARIKQQGEVALNLHLRATLRIRDAAFVPGETYRVHLPLPTPTMQQRDVKILDIRPNPKHIARESAPQRTAFFEETLHDNAPFVAEYSYTWHSVYADVWDGEPFIAYPDAPLPTEADLQEHAPHIAFTPYLKQLALELRGDEVIPIRIVRRIYNYITSHVRYAYVRAYRLIENGAEYAAANLRGDCGLQALLFITLCRILGIPARWESGLMADPTYIGSHDWAQFYTEAWGWLPVDCSFGGAGYRKNSPERRAFYLGNIDPWRMAANTHYYAPFQPASQHVRSDPYDSQRGEVETARRALTSGEIGTRFEMVAYNERESP